jgi:hypothetical protein
MKRFDLLYLNEKAEELRSRVALAHSSVNTIDQIFFNVYNKCIINKKVPPFIYPRKQIEDLNRDLKELKNEIDRIENEEIVSNGELSNALFLSLAINLAILEPKCMEILSSSQDLLLVLEQRILDLEIFDDLKYNENLQHQFIGLTKVFESVDALTYQLLKNTLGEKWIEHEKFAPVTILGEKDYCINTENYVINIPYHDCFRSRYWAALSHEVAHIFVHYYFRILKNEEFVELVERNIYKLGKILDAIYNDIDWNVFVDYPVISQVFELICDVVACFTCGSPPLLSLCTYDRFSLSEVFLNEDQLLKVRQNSHPPLFFRTIAMKKTLEYTGILDLDNDLSDFIASIERVTEFDTRHALLEFGDGSLPDIFPDYFKFTEQISDDILGFLDELAHSRKIESFGRHEFINLMRSLKNMKWDKLTPIEAMNVVWLKRRVRTFETPGLSTGEFYRGRKNETKIFETMVNICYNYYEKTVFPETKKYIYEEVNS